MSKKTGYIAGALNIAFFKGDNDRLYLLQNGEDTVPQPADGYSWSQLCAAPTEYSEIEFSSTEELKKAISREAAKQEALDMALELMDTRFSATYREGIAELLAEALEKYSGLITFIENRLLASPLPDAFDPEMAMQVLNPFAPVAAKIFYNDLAEKAKLFTNFYTLFITALSVETKEEQLIRKLLTDNGCFSAFTNALYRGSDRDYRIAATTAVIVFKTNGINASDIDFNAIAGQLYTTYKTQLKEDKISKIKDIFKGLEDTLEKRLSKSDIDTELLYMGYVRGCTTQEIAEELNLSKSFVLSRLKRLHELLSASSSSFEYPATGFNNKKTTL
jgi:hypothetical protein